VRLILAQAGACAFTTYRLYIYNAYQNKKNQITWHKRMLAPKQRFLFFLLIPLLGVERGTSAAASPTKRNEQTPCL